MYVAFGMLDGLDFKLSYVGVHIAMRVCTKGVGDSATSKATASPLCPLLHKKISLQIKIIGNSVIGIAECWFL